MATYFDPTDEDDLLLLSEAVRKSQEVANVAGVAERDVIRFFTRRESAYSRYLGFPTLLTEVNADLGLTVFLAGYEEDADDANTDPDLKQALKETIADVISWRMKRRLKDPAIASESSDVGKSVTYDESRHSGMPTGFSWRLNPFDVQEPVWGL